MFEKCPICHTGSLITQSKDSIGYDTIAGGVFVLKTKFIYHCENNCEGTAVIKFKDVEETLEIIKRPECEETEDDIE